MLVEIYLKGTATDFYKKNKAMFTQQIEGVAETNLKEGLIRRFTSAATKDTWYADYLNYNQDLTEIIEGYTNCFKKLFK